MAAGFFHCVEMFLNDAALARSSELGTTAGQRPRKLCAQVGLTTKILHCKGDNKGKT